ncbi:MAG: methionyl-tRNA formyltransferase [Bacteroidales bacterium]
MSENILFMGTPEFASECLKSLVEANMNVVAVVTIPDKATGRGQKTHISPVKAYALQQGIPILQPLKLKDSAFLEELSSYQADLQIVVAFRMLPFEVWNMPRLGTFNLHASLLPKYRGAAPIQRSIWNGETETGVTTFLLDKDIDTGDILYQEKVSIEPTDNAGSLHDKLLSIGAPLVVKTAKDLFQNRIPRHTQNTTSIDHFPSAPKIFKEDCYLNFGETAELLALKIRALSPYPGSIACLKSSKTGQIIPLKIYESSVSENLPKTYQQGTLLSDNKHFLKIVCKNGSSISLKKLQLPGKKILSIEEFLRGFPLDSLHPFCCVDVMNN